MNLEYLGRVVFSKDDSLAYPDTLAGTDSHTTMINGIGCLGWGVGGIEAEAAMLGQPITMLLPEVIGVSVKGSLKEGVTATEDPGHLCIPLRSIPNQCRDRQLYGHYNSPLHHSSLPETGYF